jgi:hypothetical protein
LPINLEALGAKEKSQSAEDFAKRLARQLVAGKSREELLTLAGAFVKQQADEAPSTATASDSPKTPDELWDYIYRNWGVKIARVAVCDGHDAPFDFICLGFFETVPNLFSIGSRGSGKSFATALLMELNSRLKPGCESMVFGAVDEQNRKVYQDMAELFINGGLPEGESEIVGEPLASLVQYKNGSRVKSAPGTRAKMNGQHPPKAHGEEIEIFNPEAYKESRNMAADKILRDGSVIKAQNFGTSTRKWKNGVVDKIFQNFLKAKASALALFSTTEVDHEVREHITITSPWYCVIYCIFEVAAPVYECREAPENRDRPDSELCRCNQVINGSWDRDGNDPRTLASVCRGRLYRSRGHRSYGEVVQLFLQNDQGTWEAQQECIDTETEGLYIPNFSRRRHGLARFSLDVANGPIYTGTDWGFSDEAAVLWVQYLERPVEAIGYDGEIRVLPRGARVAFAELTIAQKTATELGQLAIVREVKLANVMSIKRAPVRRRWADIQGAGDRRDWAKMGLRTARYSTRNFDEHVKEWRGMVDADRFFVVVDVEEFTGMGCPFLCDQLESWREEDGKESRKQPQHVVSAGRYVLYGMHDVYMDSGAQSPEQTEAQKMSQGTASAPAAVAYEGPSAYGDRELLQAESDWRARV